MADEGTNTGMDSVHLIYLEEKRLLPCNVRLYKVIVSSVEDVLSRLLDARVEEEAETGAYVNAWFQLNGALHEAVEIAGAITTCKLYAV
jgi:hypothetical protein